jgi:hypothetical protein
VQTPGPRAAIVVAAHGGDRRQGGQLFQDARIADVAAVNDVVAAAQEVFGFGPQETVGVGDEAYAGHGWGVLCHLTLPFSPHRMC